MLPRDYTDQENLVAEILDEFGFRYERQLEFGTRNVDFYISETEEVIEVDGIYGHLRKADKKRDEELVEFPDIRKVNHVTGTTRKDLKIELNLIFGVE